MKLIIQIPCYNEEETLGITVNDLPKSIDGIDCLEYLIINDGSKDNTVQAARDAGVHHIVNFKTNKGLAHGFMAGIDACLRLGADIIVNTDADNQYNGADIEKLIRPIINQQADIVIGERPIATTSHFSGMKKRLQVFGSLVVRIASGTKIPDAPSGFRAYSREAAMHFFVFSEYTYTLETIIQAGVQRMAITSVPIQTNPDLRKSRLFKSMTAYVRRSAVTIVRSFMMYKPLRFFSIIGSVCLLAALAIGIRFLVSYFTGSGGGQVQSLILLTILSLLGFQSIFLGLQADIIAANRKILEEIKYRVKKIEYSIDNSQEKEKEQ